MLDPLEDVCPGQSQFGYPATSVLSCKYLWQLVGHFAASDLGPPQRLSNYAKLVERTG
jgi:hypothetical protein